LINPSLTQCFAIFRPLQTCLSFGVTAFIFAFGGNCQAEDGREQEWMASILKVQPLGKDYQAVMSAAKALASSPDTDLFHVLGGMKGATPIAKNWLRSVAAEVAERSQPTVQSLLAFFGDRENDPDARYLVYRWIISKDAKLEESLLKKSLDDPCLALRYLSIAKALEQAAEVASSNADEAKQLYRRALVDARNPSQLKAIADALKDLGDEIDLSKQLGMFAAWYVIGPFDNTDGAGFDNPYAVEQMLLEDGANAFRDDASMDGKKKSVKWSVASTKDAMGSVDLNPIFDKEKDAVCYAFCEFESPGNAIAEARLGSINANKVWVNGKLVLSNEVYHSGSMVDQYIGACDLNAGSNWVLIKVCQNNQTDSWAQDWQFQFRITDATGKPVDIVVTAPAQVSVAP
jgi:hypothetical protein